MTPPKKGSKLLVSGSTDEWLTHAESDLEAVRYGRVVYDAAEERQ